MTAAIAMVMVGVVAVTVGASLIAPAAGWVVAGSLLIAVGLLYDPEAWR